MTAAALLIAAALLGQARAVVNLSCSDNATCIENLTNEFVRSVRQQKTVRLFDTLTVEPLGTWQKRSSEGLLEKILNNNAFSFDWNDYTFRIWKAQDRSDALDLEVYESRTAKDVSEELPKKSKSKVEEEDDETDKKSPVVVKGDPKRRGGLMKRRAKKKIMQAVIPMLVGMKSAAVVIFAMAVVTVLTLKAFIASKMALLVTVGMAVKRLYESYSLGIPEALWNLARYFRILFGLPPISPLSSPTMTMPMYVMPQMYGQMGQMGPIGQASQVAQPMTLPGPQMQ